MTATPESWERQLHDTANTIPDTDGMEAIRHALLDHITGLYEALGWPADLDPDDALSRAAALRDEHEQLRIRAEKHRRRLVAAEDDLLCIRADLSHAGYRLGERVTPAVETILRELRQARAYAQHAVREATEVNRRLNARCAALWDLLKRQTREMRTWRRRATTTIADAVEQTAHDMQRAGQLRRERDEARAEVEQLLEAKREAVREARRVISQYLVTAEQWRYDRVMWAFAIMLGEIPDDSPEPLSPADAEARAALSEPAPTTEES